MTNVLTLRLDADSQAHFEALRQRYFPPERNQIPAHLSLFHTLPDTDDIAQVLADEAARQGSFQLAVTGVRSLGRGVAYRLKSPALLSLHRRLAREFTQHLSVQDKQPLQPHIVVQNKTTSVAARDLLVELQAGFLATQAQAVGLDLWHYLGGPWNLAHTFPFTGNM